MPCPTHHVERFRPSRHQRGYDSEHSRRSDHLRQEAKDKGWPCVLCDRPIDFALRAPHPFSFAAHHTTRDKRGPLAPSHKRCNERAGQPTASAQG